MFIHRTHTCDLRNGIARFFGIMERCPRFLFPGYALDDVMPCLWNKYKQLVSRAFWKKNHQQHGWKLQSCTCSRVHVHEHKVSRTSKSFGWSWYAVHRRSHQTRTYVLPETFQQYDTATLKLIVCSSHFPQGFDSKGEIDRHQSVQPGPPRMNKAHFILRPKIHALWLQGQQTKPAVQNQPATVKPCMALQYSQRRSAVSLIS